MTTIRTTATELMLDRPRYEPLLTERVWLGRLYADHLSHLTESAPQALRVFHSLLRYDAILAGYRRYDADLFRLVIPAEDARMHQPPQRPTDHHWSPCSLCLRHDLQLDPNVVLPTGTKDAR